MPINRQNQGRSFEVLHNGVASWVRGNIFTEYEFRRATPLNITVLPGDDPATVTNHEYEVLLDRLLRMTPPAIRIISQPEPEQAGKPINPAVPINQQGATFAPATNVTPAREPTGHDLSNELTLAEGLMKRANELRAINKAKEDSLLVAIYDRAGGRLRQGVNYLTVGSSIGLSANDTAGVVRRLQRDGFLVIFDDFLGRQNLASLRKEGCDQASRIIKANASPQQRTPAKCEPKERWYKRKVKGVANEIKTVTNKSIAFVILIVFGIVVIFLLDRYAHLNIPFKPLIDKINPLSTKP